MFIVCPESWANAETNLLLLWFGAAKRRAACAALARRTRASELFDVRCRKIKLLRAPSSEYFETKKQVVGVPQGARKNEISEAHRGGGCTR